MPPIYTPVKVTNVDEAKTDSTTLEKQTTYATNLWSKLKSRGDFSK